jgi:hypothetical protein
MGRERLGVKVGRGRTIMGLRLARNPPPPPPERAGQLRAGYLSLRRVSRSPGIHGDGTEKVHSWRGARRRDSQHACSIPRAGKCKSGVT